MVKWQAIQLRKNHSFYPFSSKNRSFCVLRHFFYFLSAEPETRVSESSSLKLLNTKLGLTEFGLFHANGPIQRICVKTA